jgi:hypothetical protein
MSETQRSRWDAVRARPNRHEILLVDYVRCPKAEAGKCPVGGSWMVEAWRFDAEGHCECPTVTWQAHCPCGWVSTPYEKRSDARYVGRGHAHQTRTRLTEVQP